MHFFPFAKKSRFISPHVRVFAYTCFSNLCETNLNANSQSHYEAAASVLSQNSSQQVMNGTVRVSHAEA